MPYEPDQPETMITSSAKWNNRLEYFKKNWYFIVAFLIVIIPLAAFIFNRITPLSIPAPKGYICPATKNFCKSFKDIKSKDGTFIGIGNQKLASNSSLLAVFDGETILSQRFTKSGDKFYVLYLLNREQKKQAYYWYKGNAPVKKRFKKGEVIATPLNEPMIDYDKAVFIFSVFDDKGNPMHLSQKEFIQ